MPTIKLIFNQIIAGYKDLFVLLKESIGNNKRLFIVYLLIASLCSAVFIASYIFGWLGSVLSLAISTPWGVVTSIFVHGGGVLHISSNLAGLLLCFALFSVVNLDHKIDRKILGLKWFLILIFCSAIIADLFWLILRPDSTTSGISGVVYASGGVVIALSLINSRSIPSIKNPMPVEQKKNFMLWLINISVFIVAFAFLVFNPALFISEGAEVNVFAHGVSFLIAFCSILIQFLIFPTKKSLPDHIERL